MPGRRPGRPADEREAFVDDLRINDVTELRQPALQTMMQFERVESLRLVQLGAGQDEVADRLRSQIEPFDRWRAANLATDSSRAPVRSLSSRQSGGGAGYLYLIVHYIVR